MPYPSLAQSTNAPGLSSSRSKGTRTTTSLMKLGSLTEGRLTGRCTKHSVNVRFKAVDDLWQLELDRLDRLQASLSEKAMEGDVCAVGIVLMVIDQRIRLLGLRASDADLGCTEDAGPRTAT